MRSAVAGRHVLWRSQLSRSPTAACGGHPQRSSRIAAAACARRAPCEPFEAAPSFLCHGVVAAREFARCPAIANFTLCGKRGAASYCGLLQAVAKSVDLGPRTADQPVWERERKPPVAEQGGAGLDRRTDGRSMAEEGEVRRDARGRYHHRSADEPYHRPLATRTPFKHHNKGRARRFGACTSQCFVSLILHGRPRPKRCRNATSKRRIHTV